MTGDVKWHEVRDCATAIAADRMRRGVLTVREIADALDGAYEQGWLAAEAACPPGGWETGL